MSLFERYQQGEHTTVWDELLQFEGDIYQHPQFNDAWMVAQETMRRVRENVETLYQRLLSIDYRFVDPDGAFVPPSPDVDEKIREFENRIGSSIPLSLRAWFKMVGKVDFCGSHPELSSYYPLPDNAKNYPKYRPHEGDELYCYYSDPLYFWDIDEALELSDDEGSPEVLKSRLYIPDWFTKASVSGSDYYIQLSHAVADTPLEYEPHQTTFVDYLRTAFRWGGFPGFDLHTSPKFESWRQKWRILPVYAEMPVPYKTLQFLSTGLHAI